MLVFRLLPCEVIVETSTTRERHWLGSAAVDAPLLSCATHRSSYNMQCTFYVYLVWSIVVYAGTPLRGKIACDHGNRPPHLLGKHEQIKEMNRRNGTVNQGSIPQVLVGGLITDLCRIQINMPKPCCSFFPLPGTGAGSWVLASLGEPGKREKLGGRPMALPDVEPFSPKRRLFEGDRESRHCRGVGP